MPCRLWIPTGKPARRDLQEVVLDDQGGDPHVVRGDRPSLREALPTSQTIANQCVTYADRRMAKNYSTESTSTRCVACSIPQPLSRTLSRTLSNRIPRPQDGQAILSGACSLPRSYSTSHPQWRPRRITVHLSATAAPPCPTSNQRTEAKDHQQNRRRLRHDGNIYSELRRILPSRDPVGSIR